MSLTYRVLAARAQRARFRSMRIGAAIAFDKPGKVRTMGTGMGRIHPTAIISREAEIAPDVEIGPYVVIEGEVRIGPGCVLRPFAHLCGPMSLGSRNQIFT